ncbi:hypothetical protein KC19_4G017600 [Ceratodon purpureus]|uniref:Uncharacterized protein n=1 Tax=Ceratodon purpureus TaxID=3225 RepID=A0A8T0I789_CERPU|nr:hypothetical protein KC19_4G017600 [Ceratodon purpureus]
MIRFSKLSVANYWKIKWWICTKRAPSCVCLYILGTLMFEWLPKTTSTISNANHKQCVVFCLIHSKRIQQNLPEDAPNLVTLSNLFDDGLLVLYIICSRRISIKMTMILHACVHKSTPRLITKFDLQLHHHPFLLAIIHSLIHQILFLLQQCVALDKLGLPDT